MAINFWVNPDISSTDDLIYVSYGLNLGNLPESISKAQFGIAIANVINHNCNKIVLYLFFLVFGTFYSKFDLSFYLQSKFGDFNQITTSDKL